MPVNNLIEAMSSRCSIYLGVNPPLNCLYNLLIEYSYLNLIYQFFSPRMQSSAESFRSSSSSTSHRHKMSTPSPLIRIPCPRRSPQFRQRPLSISRGLTCGDTYTGSNVSHYNSLWVKKLIPPLRLLILIVCKRLQYIFPRLHPEVNHTRMALSHPLPLMMLKCTRWGAPLRFGGVDTIDASPSVSSLWWYSFAKSTCASCLVFPHCILREWRKYSKKLNWTPRISRGCRRRPLNLLMTSEISPRLSCRLWI